MSRYALSITDGENDFTFYCDDKEFLVEFGKMLSDFAINYSGKIVVKESNKTV